MNVGAVGLKPGIDYPDKTKHDTQKGEGILAPGFHRKGCRIHKSVPFMIGSFDSLTIIITLLDEDLSSFPIEVLKSQFTSEYLADKPQRGKEMSPHTMSMPY